MPSHLHISDDIAKPRQTSFANTPRKINFLPQGKPEEEKKELSPILLFSFVILLLR